MNKFKIIRQISYTTLILCIISQLSCRKDKDEPPSATVQSPSAYSVFAFNDTIPFSIIVSDDKEVTSVSVYLADENTTPVTAPLNIPVNEKEKTIYGEYHFSGKYLDDVSYYLVFAVNDQTQFTKELVPVSISPLQKQLTDIFVVYQSGSQYRLGRTSDSLQSPTDLISFSEIPTDIIANSFSQQISVLFGNGSIITYNYPEMELAWTYNGLNNPVIPFASHLDIKDNLTLCGSAYGRIHFFDQTGNIRKTISSGNSTQQTEYFYFAGNYIISLNQGYASSLNSIAISSYSGTGMISDHQSVTNPLAISKYSTNEVLIWSQDKVFTFNYTNPYLYFKNDLPADTVSAVYYIDETRQILFFRQSIYQYNPLFNTFTFINNTGARDVFSDESSNQYFGVKNTSLYLFNGNSIFNEVTTGNEMFLVTGMYNK